MGETVNVHEAKTHLSKLLARVKSGEEIIIARAGEPIAKLVPIGKKLPQRVSGRLKGRMRIAPDFDAPLPDDILNEFYK